MVNEAKSYYVVRETEFQYIILSLIGFNWVLILLLYLFQMQRRFIIENGTSNFPLNNQKRVI